MARRWKVLNRRRARKANGHVDTYPNVSVHYFDDYQRYYDDYPEHDFDDEESDGDCFHCGGDGWVDGYEDDPLFYVPDELIRCCSCNGSGRAKDMTIW